MNYLLAGHNTSNAISQQKGFSALPGWLEVLKNTAKILFLRCCRSAGYWNVSLKSEGAAGGLAGGAMTRIEAAVAWGRTERFVAPTNQTAATERARRLGQGTAALGRDLVGAVGNGGACYTWWVSPNHWPEGVVVEEAEVVGAA